MKQLIFISFYILVTAQIHAQTIAADTLPYGVVTVHKDARIDILGKKMAEHNSAVAYSNARTAKGYRLMLLSTSDRAMAMNLRSRLLQQYPGQGVYMSFQSPYIKLKFGNFLEKADAEKMRKQFVNQKLVPGNIYIVPETIEVKPDKNMMEENE